MTRDTGLLNDAELETVSGGGGLPLVFGSSIDLPKIPRAKDLLTPDQIDKLLTVPFNPPPPRG
jgi:hypothetical protein